MSYVVRVWDAPTRLFHWALVGLVVGLVVTAQVGGSAMDWHFRLGYSVLALLLFRFAWGFVGGYWSRFSSFLYTPSEVTQCLQGKSPASHSVGHNPLGALSVFALLLFLLLQVGSGLFSDDEIAATGPLSKFVASAWVGNATFYHKEVGKLALLALVALHLAAIGFYFFKKKENLVKPMIHGDKTLDFLATASQDGRGNRLKAAAILFACAVLVGVLVRWAA
jgi:cytochrome b